MNNILKLVESNNPVKVVFLFGKLVPDWCPIGTMLSAWHSLPSDVDRQATKVKILVKTSCVGKWHSSYANKFK